MLDLLIYYHRRKLEKYIRKKKSYKKVLKQSQILDRLINKKMNIINIKTGY